MDILCSMVLAAGSGAILPFVRPAPEGEPADGDFQLIRDATDGKRPAQHALYTRHYERVRTRIGRLLGRSSEVDDVLQDTFVAAFRDLAQLNDPARFGSWVCGIAVHQVHRRLRRRKLLSRLGFNRDVDEGTLSQAIDRAASPETHLLVKQLERALESLSPRQRLAWVLRYVEGYCLDEITEQCQSSLATVKRDIAQAELHLNARLFDQGEIDER